MFPRAFPNNSLCKIWGANRVHYGELENRELRESLCKRGPLRFASENRFPLNFAHEYKLVQK